MNKTRQYSPEVRERAVRLVFAHEGEYPSQWAAITSIAEKIGCSAETLRNWVRRAERDTGRRPGLTTEERGRLKDQVIPIAPSTYYAHKAADEVDMQRVLVIAISLAAVSVSTAPAQDRWDELRHQVLELNRRGNMAGAVRAAEHPLNLADSEFANDRERGLEALMLLSTQYRNQRAYGKEELTRYRELELGFALKAPSPTADGSLPAEADVDLDEVRTHYARPR